VAWRRGGNVWRRRLWRIIGETAISWRYRNQSSKQWPRKASVSCSRGGVISEKPSMQRKNQSGGGVNEASVSLPAA